MMFLLTFNIILYIIHMALGDRERSIAILPTESVKHAITLIDPFTTVDLNQTNTITQRHCF